MKTDIVPATTKEHFAFIAKRFEETITLWENYKATPTSVRKRKAQLLKWSKDKNVHLTVALGPSRKTVAFNSVYISKDYSGNAYGKIVILYVLPNFRGNGIAASLKAEGETWLRSMEVTKILTEIDAKNARMLKLNKKAGFKIKSYTFERGI
ncbi:MAG: GNAT family N-acetyltransferase [Elusimicrobia bacterium]|nr:GNAT family N-acetyltransferase [Elusimicrobiota bacterium]